MFNSPEQKYKNIEKKIFQLLEESILASTGSKPDVIAGLAKAKEASSMDRTLLRMRNQSGSNNFTHNFDLTYSVSSWIVLKIGRVGNESCTKYWYKINLFSVDS